jgi:hypothetical protein
MRGLPVVGPDVSVWANDMRRYLGRQLDRLSWRVTGQTAAENGMILWDESTSSPVVSRDGVWASISSLYNSIYVSRAEQLTGAIDSTKIYVIDGIIDIGSGTINIPAGGMSLKGFGFGISGIVSTADNSTIFSYSGAFSGSLLITGLDIQASGSGSKVFNLDNAENLGRCEFVDTTFSLCSSLGELARYRQGLIDDVSFLSCVDGLTLSGNWADGFRATTAIIVGSTFTGTVFKAGAALVLQGRFITDMNAINLADAGVFCNFAPVNLVSKPSFLVLGLSVNSVSNSFPNMPRGDPKARFSQCVGTQNTYVGAQWSMATETATACTTATPVKLAGSTTYANQNWFTNTISNAFVYGGGVQAAVSVGVNLSFSGTNGQKIKTIIRKWVNSSSSYLTVSASGPQTMNASNKVESVSMQGFTSLELGDRIEVWIENDSNGSVTAQLGGLVSVSERAS